MAYNWNGISSAEDTVEADDIMDGVEQTELFVNQGMGKNSFRAPDELTLSEKAGRPNHEREGFIDKKHIYKPDFYASPSPRMEAVSSQVHYRTTGQSHSDGVVFTPTNAGTGSTAIPGTATRLKLRDYARVYFTASFYCFEFGGLMYPKGVAGSGATLKQEHQYYGGETRFAGGGALSLQGKTDHPYEYESSTYRKIYTSLLAPYRVAIDSGSGSATTVIAKGFCLLNMIGRHQHNIVYTTSLNPGVYDIGLVFQSGEAGWITSPAEAFSDLDMEGGQIRRNKAVFFMARNMVADVMYTGRASAESELAGWRTRNPDDPQAI